jgi:RimJ/RimL family protein N-acetyltransferase
MDLEPPPTLHGERVRLRATKEEDVAARAALGRSREIVRSFGGDLATVGPMSEEDARLQLEMRFGRGPHWVIADTDDDLIGITRLAPVDTENRSARFSIGIFDPALLGRGLGTEATRLVVRFGFDEMRLHRISLTVLADNHRAIQAYRNCGFAEEGRFRETLWRDGEWHDDLSMAILADE